MFEKYLKDGILSTVLTISTGVMTELLTNILLMIAITIVSAIVVPFIRYLGHLMIEKLKMSKSDVEKVKSVILENLKKELQKAKKKGNQELIELLENEINRFIDKEEDENVD